MRLVIDFTLFVSPLDGGGEAAALGLDLPAFVETKTRRVRGETRRYYAAHPPRLVLIVCRKGLDLRDLSGCVVDAAIGWDEGAPGYVLPANVGRRHTKITVFQVLERPQDLTRLSEVMAAAPLAHGVIRGS